MDMYLVNALTEALHNAQKLGGSALAMRDTDQLILVIAQSNKQLQTAEQVLALHKKELATVHQELADARQTIQQLEIASTNREGYTLVEIASGVLAYRWLAQTAARGSHKESKAAPEFFCQHCMDCGLKSALQHLKAEAGGTPFYHCPICKKEFPANLSVTRRRLAGHSA
ncbi:hypothetical protein ACO0LO_12365 [Undibacterium sp. TJN25]|uniref:hypothetical protein n=1 Tax=Undibacterium sp. TJN25 TaxID=3413056 RepID=UPI003BF1E5DF